MKVSIYEVSFCSLEQLSATECDVATYLADGTGMDCGEWGIVAYELVNKRAPW